jgi:hypothetical protein
MGHMLLAACLGAAEREATLMLEDAMVETNTLCPSVTALCNYQTSAYTFAVSIRHDLDGKARSAPWSKSEAVMALYALTQP